MSFIDLRSDTVTRPTGSMRRAMAEAEVGDDVYGEDPTVNRLQERAAEVFEKEAALFVPTGSMGNQIAVKLHTRPGTEVVIEERGHIYNYEMAAMSAISGALARPVKSVDGSGILKWEEIKSAVRASDSPYYVARTGLVALENSHNLAGGAVLTRERTEEICDGAHALGLPVHLDGARIFNAATALNESVESLGRARRLNASGRARFYRGGSALAQTTRRRDATGGRARGSRTRRARRDSAATRGRPRKRAPTRRRPGGVAGRVD